MKAYKIELLVIDHDGIGSDEIQEVLENIQYPNRCIYPDVKNIEGRDIGEWHDDHPFNSCRKSDSEYRRIFA